MRAFLPWRAARPAADAEPVAPPAGIDPQRAREILEKVRRIEIRTSRLASETFAGAYHSVFKGRGMDFDEVREYVPGDEVRTIDWNVTARSGRPFVKKYVEERELAIMLLVDLSGSLGFGSSASSKRELAAEVAAVLAFSAVRNQDKVGLVVFTDEVEAFLPARKGRSHVLRVVRELLFFEPRGRRTDLPRAVDSLARALHRRAVVFLLSDFLVPDLGPLRRSLEVTARRHDVVALVVGDPREREIPDVGRLTIDDAETGEQLEIDTGDAAARARFTAAADERRRQTVQMLRGCGVDTLELDTAVAYLPALLRFFRERAARQRR